MKRFLAIIACLSLVLTGCENLGFGSGDKLEDLFSAEEMNQLVSFSADGGSVELNFNPQYNWEAYANVTWISVSPSSGSGGFSKIVVTLEKNNTESERSGYVFVELTGGITFKIPVKQKAKEEDKVVELVEDGQTFEINSDGGSITITVKTNTEYTVHIPSAAQSWLSLDESRAMRYEDLKFTATKNDSGVTRQATIKLLYSDNEVSFVIMQKAATDNDEPVSISVSPKTLSFDAAGGSETIIVTSNAPWTVACAESGISIAPTSGVGNDTVTVNVPASNVARDFNIDFSATLNGSSANTTVYVSQTVSELTPGEHQDRLEKTGQAFLKYFNPEDSRNLANSISRLIDAGGFDFRLAPSGMSVSHPVRAVRANGIKRFMSRIIFSVYGVSRFSAESITRLSTTLILPDGSYTLDDFKGMKYTFDFSTGTWKEESIGNVNKIVAVWDTTTVTLTWVEGSASWEGYVDYDYKAKLEGIPSKADLTITIDGAVEFSSTVKVEVPSNYAINTETVVSLKGGYVFTVIAKGDRKGVEGSLVVSKNSEKIASGSGKVAINDLTDSKNWWGQYTDRWYDGNQWHEDVYTCFDGLEYGYEHVKTGEGHATILDVALQASGNLRTIFDEVDKINDLNGYDGAALFSSVINSNATAYMYYTDNNAKIADVKAEPIAYEEWMLDENAGQEVLKTIYEPAPVLIFTDGSKFAINDYFTDIAFGNLIDAAEELCKSYENLLK